MKKISEFFLSQNFQVLEVNFSIYLNRRVFVMFRERQLSWISFTIKWDNPINVVIIWLDVFRRQLFRFLFVFAARYDHNCDNLGQIIGPNMNPLAMWLDYIFALRIYTIHYMTECLDVLVSWLSVCTESSLSAYSYLNYIITICISNTPSRKHAYIVLTPLNPTFIQ